MTVLELIELLQKLPPELEVARNCGDSAQPLGRKDIVMDGYWDYARTKFTDAVTIGKGTFWRGKIEIDEWLESHDTPT